MATTARPADWPLRARAIAPAVAAAADAIERERRLPGGLLDALHGAGLFRMLLPRSQNGHEVEPRAFFETIEEIAKADASVAWCLCQASGCSMAAAYLAPETAWEIFGSDPRAVLAWGPGPKVRAVAVEGGYRVTGQWSFASGGRHANWLGAHCPVVREDGSPVLDAEGRRVERTMLLPASDAVWTDIWDVTGLRGTASDAFATDGLFVPAARSITRDFTKERREPGPLYRISALAMYEIGFAGVALGIARAALDAFVAMARDKVPRGMRSPIRDNAVVQSGAAQAEAKLRAARLALLHEIDAVWDGVARGGAFTLEGRMAFRLASTFAIHQAREAVDFAYHAAGATAIFGSHPLERRFRDVHTVAQQLQGRAAHFETVGAWLLGGEPDLTFV